MDDVLPTGMAAHAALRAATAACHARVDAAFGGFDLTDRADYAPFLRAHARVLPVIEDVLAAVRGLPVFARRGPALADDLAALGVDMPAAVAITPPASTAAAFGMLYVVEGSRLGGAMLARVVPPDFPSAYLRSTHARGGWRALLQALDDAGAGGGEDWMAAASTAAIGTFADYEQAAATEMASARTISRFEPT